MKLKKSIHALNATFILIALVLISQLLIYNEGFVEKSYVYITTLSFVTLFFQMYQMKKFSLPIMSVVCVFIILTHIFHFGNFYLKAFGKEEFFVFEDWFKTDGQLKADVGLFALCSIQAIHTGVLIYGANEKKQADYEYKFARHLSRNQKEKTVFVIGCLLFAMSLPARLLWDYRAILESNSAGMYMGVTASNGLIDDLQILFVPALVCILYGKKSNKRFNQIVMTLYIIAAIVIMTASGARRQYITGIFAVLIFYYNTFSKNASKKRSILKYITIFVLAMVMFNILYLIRAYRKTALGIFSIIFNHTPELFSINFIWETAAEFGLTGMSLFNAIKYFPTTIPFQMGRTYINSFIYILPIGWLIKLQASIGGALYAVTQQAVGGSVLTDLYGNWGWLSIPFAVMLGYILASLENIKGKGNELRSAVGFCTGSLILSYARGGLLETIRPVAIVAMFIFVGCKFYLELMKRRN